MTTSPTAPTRVDVTQFAGKDTMIRLIRQEYRACFDMLVAASEQEWHAQTPCELWEVRDMAGHLLDAAYCYLGYFKQAEHGWPTEEPRGMRAYGDALGHSALEYRSVYRWEVLGRLEACTELLFSYFDRLGEDEWAGKLVPHRWVGPVPAFMMAAFQLMDYSVHNWDLRKALGKDAFVDHEASDTLVPFMFGLMQICFAPELAEGEGYPYWLGLTDDDVLLTGLPLSHLNAQAYSTLGSFGCGARLVLQPGFSASTFWETARDTGATVVNAIGAMVEILMTREPSPAEREHRLRYCYSAPAPHRERHQEIEQRFGFRLVIGYALSESPYGLISPVDEPTVYGSMGRPRQHPRLGRINSARVADPVTGADVAAGEVGELLLRNPATTPGYFGRPEESAAALRDGWLHTGDLARRDEAGNYYFAGRVKEMIRRRGENLSPADVEVVLDAHPAVSSSAVIGVSSPLTEEDVKAFVLLRPGEQVGADELREWCADRLPPYKQPRYLEFVEHWPLTETQKIAKKQLPTDRTATEIDLDRGSPLRDSRAVFERNA